MRSPFGRSQKLFPRAHSSALTENLLERVSATAVGCCAYDPPRGGRKENNKEKILAAGLWRLVEFPPPPVTFHCNSHFLGFSRFGAGGVRFSYFSIFSVARILKNHIILVVNGIVNKSHNYAIVLEITQLCSIFEYVGDVINVILFFFLYQYYIDAVNIIRLWKRY